MAAKNDITGDSIKSKGPSTAYEDGWDRIFGKHKTAEEALQAHVNGFPNDKMFNDEKVCKKCGFKQQTSKEPPVLLCQSCGELL